MEARAMVGLLRLGTAGSAELSNLSGVGRSNLYPVLESLEVKGLCRRAPGRYRLWVASAPDEVIAILRRAQEERINSERTDLAEAERLVEKLPATKRAESPISLVDDARSGVMYLGALATVASEILVLNRGPYPGDLTPAPPVLEALERGVAARAIYVSAELDAPDGQLRRGADAYAAAGVMLRVVEALPLSMAVIGDDTVLLSLPSVDESSVALSHAVTIRHAGMVELGAAAFEYMWERARPYETPMTATASSQQHGDQ